MRRLLLALACAVPLATSVACVDSTTSPQAQVIESTTFASNLGVDLAASTKTSTGVYYRDITPGTGATLAANDSAFVHYTGYFSNGVVFDSNENNGRAVFAFQLGTNAVIPGFEAGLLGMKVGGRRQIIIPPSQAYQDGNILVFNVTLDSKKP